jgi:hypothetical protein
MELQVVVSNIYHMLIYKIGISTLSCMKKMGMEFEVLI